MDPRRIFPSPRRSEWSARAVRAGLLKVDAVETVQMSHMRQEGSGRVTRWRNEFGREVEYSLVVELLRASRLVTKGINRVLEDHDLSMAQWTILTVVYFEADRQMPLGKIAVTIRVHPTTVSNAVDKLEAGGWMTRDLPDRRTVLARITPEGAVRLGKVQAGLISSHFGLAPITGEEDVALIHKALRLLRPDERSTESRRAGSKSGSNVNEPQA